MFATKINRLFAFVLITASNSIVLAKHDISIAAYQAGRDKVFIEKFIQAHKGDLNQDVLFADLEKSIKEYNEEFLRSMSEAYEKDKKRSEELMLKSTKEIIGKIDSYAAPMQQGLCFRFKAKDSEELKSKPDGELLEQLRKELQLSMDAMKGMQNIQEHHIFVALAENKQPLGFIRYFKMIGGQAFIFQVGVDTNARKKGIGTRLLEHACNHAKENGCMVATLEAKGPNNKIMEKLCEKVGFQENAFVKSQIETNAQQSKVFVKRL